MKKFLIQRFMAFNIWLIHISNGRLGTHMGGQTVLVLSTTGRKSGQVRAVPISYFRDGGRYFIVASNWAQKKNAAWYFNLKANPRATLEVDGETIPVLAYEAEGEEYTRLWNSATAKYPMYENYQKSVERRIPILVFESVT